MNKSDFVINVADIEYLHIQKGDGSNLSQEDMDNGYVDYIYYDILDKPCISDENIIDGGCIMLTKPYKEYTWTEIINKVLCFVYTCIKEPTKLQYNIVKGVEYD